jgi:hypothetical protein
MLVYANSFDVRPAAGTRAVIDQVALWVGQSRQTFVDPERLSQGIHELKMPEGAALSSLVTLDDSQAPEFPYFFCARLTHGQTGVPGRRWVTEVGLRQSAEHDTIFCSVVLRTDEVSAKVTTPIQATRPRIVQQIIDRCSPAGATPGLVLKGLTVENAKGFGYDIEHESRKHPLVLVSCDRNGAYPVLPSRLQSVLVGLAQVVEISLDVDTFALAQILGRGYSAYGGAINIIFPYRQTESGGFCQTELLRPDRIREFLDSGSSVESEVLASITHRTNLPHSWKHISIEVVAQARLTRRLTAGAKQASASADTAAYEELLDEAAKNLRSKDEELSALRGDIETSNATVEQLRAENDGLKYALTGSQARADVSGEVESGLAPLRHAVQAVLAGTPSLEQALRLAQGLFSDRLVVLETAFDAAQDSDRGGFQFGAKAYELLSKLAGPYWDALVSGAGDNRARDVFGKNAFASREAESMSNDGRKRRTFSYLGRDILMEKHLKVGVKDSAAETLRIHFEWFSDQKKLVIGHCGKHLDF